MKNTLSSASVVIVTYNNSDEIDSCLKSVLNQDYSNYEVIVVDNASQDGTVQQIREHFPQIHMITNKENLGLCIANNMGAKASKGEYLVFLNPDTEVDRSWLTEMLIPFNSDPTIGMTTAMILQLKGGTLNTCGLTVHYSGFTFCRGWNNPPSTYSTPAIVSSVSGCSYGISRQLFDKLGGLDDDLFLYLDDVDISMRVRLLGYKTYYNPKAVVYHKYKTNISPKKLYLIERNRLLLLLKFYSKRTLTLLMPSLLLAETLAWGLAALRGREYMRAKLEAYRWILASKSRILPKRHEVQRTRVIRDRVLLDGLSSQIPAEVPPLGLRGIAAGFIRAVSSILSAYFSSIKEFID